MANIDGIDYDDLELDDNGTDPAEDLEDRIDALESRVEELEEQRSSAGSGISLGYGLGMALAVVLSWQHNGSILWCILHGCASWLYVAYVAFVR